jgi:tRNA modification GTPase
LRGIVRISGEVAFALLARHLETGMPSGPLAASAAVSPTRRGVNRLRLALSHTTSLPVWLFTFPAPRSYTGEDSIEMQLPGNPAMLERVIDMLLDSACRQGLDARRAQPGEFTARAYLNNRISLTQAEGVAATIAAQSDAELSAARLLVSGHMGRLAHRLADDLAAALALVEAGIDFTDQEDVIAIRASDLHARLEDLRARLEDQLQHAVGFEHLRAIPWVVLVGQPNAGKSALFNALLGHERAVVSGNAGTTRDMLTEPLAFDRANGRAEVMLVDIAGLDHDDESPMNQRIQAAARQAIARAELRLHCVPLASTGPVPGESALASGLDEIIVRTKCDERADSKAAGAQAVSPGQIAVSALTGEGLSNLRAAIADRLAGRAVSLAGGGLALQPRHEHAMRSAVANLDRAIARVASQRDDRALADAEIIASSMRAALDDLAALAGDVTPDDILGRIFAGFCIGK